MLGHNSEVNGLLVGKSWLHRLMQLERGDAAVVMQVVASICGRGDDSSIAWAAQMIHMQLFRVTMKNVRSVGGIFSHETHELLWPSKNCRFCGVHQKTRAIRNMQQG